MENGKTEGRVRKAERMEIKGSNVKVSVHQAKCKAKAKLNKF